MAMYSFFALAFLLVTAFFGAQLLFAEPKAEELAEEPKAEGEAEAESEEEKKEELHPDDYAE